MNTKTITMFGVMIFAVIIAVSIPQAEASHSQADNYPVINSFTSTENSITIFWFQERINPSSEYAVYWKHELTDAWNRVTVPTGQLSYTLTGLEHTSVYHAKVIPVINGNDRLFPVHTTTTLSTMPTPVTNIQPLVVDNGQTLRLTWDADPVNWSSHVTYNVLITDVTTGHQYWWFGASTGADIPIRNLNNGDQIDLKVVVGFDYHRVFTLHTITTLFGLP